MKTFSCGVVERTLVEAPSLSSAHLHDSCHMIIFHPDMRDSGGLLHQAYMPMVEL
jgi:hypothetical protein